MIRKSGLFLTRNPHSGCEIDMFDRLKPNPTLKHPKMTKLMCIPQRSISKVRNHGRPKDRFIVSTSCLWEFLSMRWLHRDLESEIPQTYGAGFRKKLAKRHPPNMQFSFSKRALKKWHVILKVTRKTRIMPCTWDSAACPNYQTLKCLDQRKVAQPNLKSSNKSIKSLLPEFALSTYGLIKSTKETSPLANKVPLKVMTFRVNTYPIPLWVHFLLHKPCPPTLSCLQKSENRSIAPESESRVIRI